MITVQFRRVFQAAHRLSRYEGKCSRIHGHNFGVMTEVSVDELGEDGFVIEWDYVRQAIDSLDHRLILCDGDEIAQALPADWVYFVPRDPTTEFMADYLARQIVGTTLEHNRLASAVDVFVELRETDSIMAYGSASGRRET